MRFPDLELDDRCFQDLVDESRRRIGQRCPEWTDHNVASPGIMLTELFAWMTEMLAFRLNQVPDKLHLRLLELLDVHLQPPQAAQAELRFLLGGPPAEPLSIPAGAAEVATDRSDGSEPVVFATTAPAMIPVAPPIAYVLERDGSERDVGLAGGVIQPLDDDRRAFGRPPQAGDALLIGFGESLASLVLRIDVDCSEAHGAGIKPHDPPVRWEVSTGGEWLPAEVLEDETGGFNHGGGRIELQLPARHEREVIAGHSAFWVRCRVDARTRRGELVAYTAPPEIARIVAAPVGALVPAMHAERVVHEELGESDGTPGQTFTLRHAPALELGQGETLEVLDPDSGAWQTWEACGSFAGSGPDDWHFRFHAAHGEVELGPCLRDPAGRWRQHGAVPPEGALLRLSCYRHGGGASGNVRANALSELRSSIPGVARVSNPWPAAGGLDGETLEHARRRAAVELNARERAVTADDFARQAERASARVARAGCARPAPGEPVRVVILPRVDGDVSAAELAAGDDLRAEVARHLDERRLLGTTVEVIPARVREVSIVVDLSILHGADRERVEADVAAALDRYLNPITGGSLDGDGDGWAFGRTLHQGELINVVHTVAGVRFVRLLRVYEVDPTTGKPAAEPAGSRLALEADEVVAPAEHIVRTHEET